jgi:hypothetical protein
MRAGSSQKKVKASGLEPILALPGLSISPCSPLDATSRDVSYSLSSWSRRVTGSRTRFRSTRTRSVPPASNLSPVNEPHADVVEEGRRLIALAEQENLPLRLLGGVAVRLRGPRAGHSAFERPFGDLDFAAGKGSSGKTASFFEAAGYVPNIAFNTLQGSERLLFFDDPNRRQVDVFVGAFSMSHKIPLAERLELEPVSVPLAELLLTKLQIAELNEKDVRDALALLHEHPVGDEDGDSINAARVAVLCAADWGLWRTITGNLAATRARLDAYALSADEKRTVAERAQGLLDRIEAEPKSRAWRLRARIGERKRWYELPEEVAGGP